MHLTTIENIKSNTRFVSNHVDASRIEPCIDECEQMCIKPSIGDELFIHLQEYIQAEDKSTFPDYSTLLEGGVYEDGCKGQKQFKGLICALNYYVFAGLIKNNSNTVTRASVVVKTDNYSRQVDLHERLAWEKDTLQIADKYLQECLVYLKYKRDQFPKFKRGKQRNRIVTIIGK